MRRPAKFRHRASPYEVRLESAIGQLRAAAGPRPRRALERWPIAPPAATTNDLDELIAAQPIEEASEPHFGYNFAKRLFDIVVAAAALIVLSPVLIAISIMIAFSGRPIFFGQRRLGRGARAFTCWKFRTMVPDAESRRSEISSLNITDGPTFKCLNDPRLTKLGKFLRRNSIDELPQLWNVLLGDMSLVGPRPLAIDENRYRDGQQLRLAVKPGLTCIWQVSGRSDIPFDQWMAMDQEYVQCRSFPADVGLLLRTVPAVLGGKGAM